MFTGRRGDSHMNGKTHPSFLRYHHWRYHIWNSSTQRNISRTSRDTPILVLLGDFLRKGGMKLHWKGKPTWPCDTEHREGVGRWIGDPSKWCKWVKGFWATLNNFQYLGDSRLSDVSPYSINWNMPFFSHHHQDDYMLVSEDACVHLHFPTVFFQIAWPKNEPPTLFFSWVNQPFTFHKGYTNQPHSMMAKKSRDSHRIVDFIFSFANP